MDGLSVFELKYSFKIKFWQKQSQTVVNQPVCLKSCIMTSSNYAPTQDTVSALKHCMSPSRNTFSYTCTHNRTRQKLVAPLRSETPPYKGSGMARVLKGSHGFTCTPTRSSAIGMSHTFLCLPSCSWYSFADPGGMEGWVDLDAKLRGGWCTVTIKLTNAYCL